GDAVDPDAHGARIGAPEWKQLCERDGQRYRCGQLAARALADRINGRHHESCELAGKIHAALGIEPWEDDLAIIEAALKAADREAS
ncbi:MAG TPA: hypothetical protein VK854_03970, partial [Woeseiaceae bacterium]|nr:hypothetical protein [Woeseiaceae bacterium]